MQNQTPESPDFLDQRGDVRRLNRVPLIITGVLVLLILIAITYTYQMRLAEIQARAAQTESTPSAATPSDVFREAPDGGFIPAKQVEPAAPPPVVPVTDAPDPDALMRERLRQEQERIITARTAAALQAAKAPTTITHKEVVSKTPPLASEPTVTTTSSNSLYAEALQRHLAEYGERDINRSSEKAAWLQDRAQESGVAHYLKGGREAPLSPYELKAGSVIPAIMIGGINSDLPGQIIGQVRENVYDTASGRYILIPQGAKLIGTYDNAITTGQERVLVAWTRIIYPDGSSVDLGKMPGADSAGYAGLHDKVDNHFWKAFGNALMMSVFSAGVQISQGGGGNNMYGLNTQQTIAAGLGQQLGQLGQELARRNAQIQPTIEIRPGMHFTVMVTTDVIISPWRGKNS